ncbi:MAG TPA: ABC transporter ATP-binding protein [Burkholderiales bacterium]|jgi:ABC-type branched-subunit amino acid transport system ATPase component|nr:ABC transporter ATP-binding protein [Burkholderiales bacterium]
MSHLAVQGLEKRYGGIAALDGCSFDIPGPGIYGFIGPNGAGKTTLFDIVAGATAPDRGEISLDGRRLTGFSPHRLARLGIARSFQECRVFGEYSCIENLLFSSIALGTRPDPAEAERLLKLVGLEAYATEPAASLSFGQRRLLEIVGTFLQRPRVLLLDEPAAGVNPALLEILATFILRMHEDRPSVCLVIEHNMEFIMGLAREVIVMHQGTVLERGDPQAIQTSPRVIEAYLG